MPFISDLACELLRRKPAHTHGVQITSTKRLGIKTSTTIIRTAKAADTVGKPIGTYVNIQTSPTSANDHLIKALADALQTQTKRHTPILVVGLGNDKFVADSLGPQVLQRLHTGPTLCTFEPNVGGVTGINSVDAIKAITTVAKPATVIIIDSLVSAAPARIGTNYQICTSGITPGSGIGRDNQKIDKKLLGVPVIAIGIPVCTIMTTAPDKVYHVVPKDIDSVIANCAYVIAAAINTLGLQS